MDIAGDQKIVEELLESAGLVEKISELSLCIAGGNNRVMEVSTDKGRYLVKWYFVSENDKRDRLNSEWSFLQYTSQLQLEDVPVQFSKNSQRHVALYEFIEGRKLDENEITAHEVGKAAEFLCELNAPAKHGWSKPVSPKLSNASEACFSVQDHFNLVDQRISKLLKMKPDNAIDKQAEKLVSNLKLSWEKTKLILARNLSKVGVTIDEVLSKSERCISPSDFGFQNVIRRDNGELVFIDFEYAGWDDTAKMIGDFFFQPAVPVSLDYYEEFAIKVLKNHARRDWLKKRADILLPVFGHKWCCIMLNVFIQEWAERRRFANPSLDLEKMKIEQLKKAEKLLIALENLAGPDGCNRLVKQ